MKLSFPLRALPLILLAASSFACGPTPEEQATMTAGAWTPTFTATVTATPTPIPSPTPTTTFTPSPSPTKTRQPTITPRPTDTQDPNRYYSPDDTFSLIPPENWVPLDIGLEYPALIDPALVELNVGLKFYQEENPFPAAFYSALFQDQVIPMLESYSLVSEEFSTTEAGLDLFRWEFTNQDQGILFRQVIYFFESGSWKLVISFVRPDDQAGELDEIIDEVMNTLHYTR